MTDSSSKDRLFTQPRIKVGDFCFDERVTRVFPDMIRRSVPGYDQLLLMHTLWLPQFLQPASKVYDLGCSDGALTALLAQALQGSQAQLVGLDNAPAMVEQCRINLQKTGIEPQPEIHCADITHFDYQPASVVIMNLVLQFVPLPQRSPLLQRLAQALLPGGALLLTEKLCFEDAPSQARVTQLHEDFKRSQGYSELEIANKRSALEQVLIPETLQQHQQRLQKAGFSQISVWFQCGPFVSLLAIR